MPFQVFSEPSLSALLTIFFLKKVISREKLKKKIENPYIQQPPEVAEAWFLKKSNYYESILGSRQWSTEPKQDSVIFGFRFGSARFGFFRKTEPNIYRIKSKIKGFHEVFNRNIFFSKIQ